MNSEKPFKTTLNFEDVFCIACRCIYLQPVTMPCNHTLCLDCFKNMVNITAFQCPLCRMRISNWLRKYKHNWDAMVNEKLWEAIQQQYPVEIQKRLNDEDDGIEERIVSQGFTRVLNKEGEVKKEFDAMRMNILKNTEEIELQNIELAKQLQQEEEEADKEIADRTLNDSQLALTIQEQINNELQQEQILLNEADKQLANEIQNVSSTFDKLSEIKSDTKIEISNKQKQPKKGPLDKMFSKLVENNAQVQYRNKENSCTNSSSSNTSSCSTSNTSTSSNTNTNLLATNSTTVLEESMTCTCGRLQGVLNKDISACQYCIVQISLLEKLVNQQRNDYLMAKELEKQLNMEDINNYNLRKRSSPTHNTKPNKKSKKLSNGQQTLRQVLAEKNK